MEKHKPSRIKSSERRYQAFIEHQNSCPLCGSQLVIKVETYLEDYNLREEAHCGSCDLLARVKDHKMH